MKTRLAWLMLCMMSLSIIGYAQDDLLTASFVSADGAFAFRYPEAWQVAEADTFVELVDGGWDDPDAFSLTLYRPEFLLGETLAAAHAQLRFNRGMASGDDEALLVNGQAGLWTVGTTFSQATTIAATLETPNGILGLYARAQDMTAYQPIILAMLETLTYTPPSETKEGEVVWQVQLPFEPFATGSEGTFGLITNVVAAADDTLFLVMWDTIRAMSPDGKLLHVFKPDPRPTKEFVITALAMADDGILWVAGRYEIDEYLIIQVDEQGTQVGTLHPYNATRPTLDFWIDDMGFDESGQLIAFGTLYDQDYGPLVQIYSAAGEWVSEFRPTGEDPDLFNTGATLAIKDGHLYLADRIRRPVLVYEMDGTWLDTLQPRTEVRNVIGRWGDGFLIGSEHRLIWYDAAGGYQAEFGELKPEGGRFAPGTFSDMEDFAVLSNGDVVVVDTNFEYVQVVRVRRG